MFGLVCRRASKVMPFDSVYWGLVSISTLSDNRTGITAISQSGGQFNNSGASDKWRVTA